MGYRTLSGVLVLFVNFLSDMSELVSDMSELVSDMSELVSDMSKLVSDMSKLVPIETDNRDHTLARGRGRCA